MDNCGLFSYPVVPQFTMPSAVQKMYQVSSSFLDSVLYSHQYAPPGHVYHDKGTTFVTMDSTVSARRRKRKPFMAQPFVVDESSDESDNSGSLPEFTELFVKNGSPLVFYMPFSSKAESIRTLVELNGGIYDTSGSKKRVIRLLDEKHIKCRGCVAGEDKFYDYRYVMDSVYGQQLRSLDEYRVVPSFAVKPKQSYSPEEDMQIVKYVISTHRFHEIKGLRLYKDAVEAGVCPGRTFWSIRERMLKSIISNIRIYPISEKNKKRLVLSKEKKFSEPYLRYLSHRDQLSSSEEEEQNQDSVLQANESEIFPFEAVQTEITEDSEPDEKPEIPSTSMFEDDSGGGGGPLDREEPVDKPCSSKQQLKGEKVSDRVHRVLYTSQYMGHSFNVPLNKEANVPHIKGPVVKKKARANRVPYKFEEDAKILDIIVSRSWHSDVKGKKIWIIMEKENCLGNNRTWQSMKERYRRHIVTNLHLHSVSDEDARMLIASSGLKVHAKAKIFAALKMKANGVANDDNESSS